MSWTMTHLLITDAFRKNYLKNTDGSPVGEPQNQMFLLGGIAPDAVHARPDFEKEMKAVCHYMQPGKKWGEIYTEKEMKDWYLYLERFYKARAVLCETKEELAFLQGYTLHILVDIFNCSLLYGPGFIKYGLNVEKYRADYAREHEIWDRYLAEQWPEKEKALAELESALDMVRDTDLLPKLQMDSVFQAEHLDAGIKWQIKRYRNAAPADPTGLVLISQEESDYFLSFVCEQAGRMLYSFPDSDNIFAFR